MQVKILKRAYHTHMEAKMGNGISATAAEQVVRQEQPLALIGPQPLSTLNERVEALQLTLPEEFRPFIDKYFLRARDILAAEGHNPWVRAQIFVRKGPGIVGGIEEAIAIIRKYSKIEENGGAIYAVEEGSAYEPKETLMVLEGRAQDIIELETMYLGAIAAGTTKANTEVSFVDPDVVRENVRKVKDLIGDRPLIYMGARHWSFRDDVIIARAAFEGGAEAASTDIAAKTAGKVGVGTIPHALECVYSWLYGQSKAVVESTLAFDRVIDKAIPRVALIDYNNREIDDSIAVARALFYKLKGNLTVRVDTCGENVGQGAFEKFEDVPEGHVFRKIRDQIPEEDLKYWFGRGVTVSGVYALRRALAERGYPGVRVLLSSGFGNPDKVAAFVRAEKILGGMKLFDALGAGGFLGIPCRESTMDIVAVSHIREGLNNSTVSKVGREYRQNPGAKLLEPVQHKEEE